MKTPHKRSRWLRAAALACILLPVACAPKAIVVAPAAKLPITPARESVRPVLSSAMKSASEAAAEAQRARDSVDRANAQAASANAAAQRSVTEAKRLHTQKAANEGELLALYNHLVEMENTTSILLQDIATAKSALTAEKKLSADTQSQLKVAEARAIEKDAENDELRRMLTYSETLTAQANNTAQEAVNTAEKLRTDVGVQKGRAVTWRWISIGLGSALLLALGAHVLRSYIRV